MKIIVNLIDQRADVNVVVSRIEVPVTIGGGESIIIADTVTETGTNAVKSSGIWAWGVGVLKAFYDTLYNQFNILRGKNHEPNGFINPDTDVTISFNDLNRTLTVAPVGASFDAYSASELITKTEAEDIQITDVKDNHYIYYNANGELIATTIFNLDIIDKYCIVAVVYWNVTEQKHILLNHEYLHTTKMGGKTHAYLHETRGFTIESGGGIGDLVTDGSGNEDASIRFSNQATVAWDEDARCSLAARLATDNISVYWKTGTEASPEWDVKEDAPFPVFIEAGNTLPSYNQLVGGVWQLTEMPNNSYLIVSEAVNNDLDRRFMVFLGQASYGNLNNVRSNAEDELNRLILEGMISPEFRFTGSFIIQVNNNYTNAVKARFRSIDGDTDYIDWREVAIGRGGVSGAVTEAKNVIVSEAPVANSDKVALNDSLQDVTDKVLELQDERVKFGRTIETETATLAVTDNYKIVNVDFATAITITIPQNTFSKGDWVNIQQIGAGEVIMELADDTNQFINDEVKTAGQYKWISWLCEDDTEDAEVFKIIGGIE